MSRYSIKDLENLSGIKAHTIRIWEKRYGLFVPLRTDTNIRFYNDSQLRKLLNVSSLLNKGLKISKIALFTDNQINTHLDELLSNFESEDKFSFTLINQLIGSGLAYDENGFDKAFSTSVLRYGVKDTYLKVVYPMLVKIGYLWAKIEIVPSQEHFISNLIKQKLYAAIDAVPLSGKSEDLWILFLPEEEDHEIGLLFSALLLKQHNKRVLYLGQRVPTSNLSELLKFHPEAKLLFFLVRDQPVKLVDNLISELLDKFPKVQLNAAISDDIKNEFSMVKKISLINSVEDLLKKV